MNPAYFLGSSKVISEQFTYNLSFVILFKMLSLMYNKSHIYLGVFSDCLFFSIDVSVYFCEVLQYSF